MVSSESVVSSLLSWHGLQEARERKRGNCSPRFLSLSHLSHSHTHTHTIKKMPHVVCGLEWCMCSSVNSRLLLLQIWRREVKLHIRQVIQVGGSIKDDHPITSTH